MHKLLILLLVLPFLTHAQEKKEDLITWKEGQKLSWSNYQGAPDTSVGAAASTATFLGVDYNFRNNVLGYTITCSFSQSKSWALHKNDYVLAHEQGHFDIAEIAARTLNKRLKEYVFNKNTYQTDLRTIYEDVTREKEMMQNTYDSETDHSLIKDKQVEWLQKISLLLKEYDAYKNY